MRLCLSVLISIVVFPACQGISPTVLDAHDQASKAAALYHTNLRANEDALLADLQATLQDYAADLAEARMRAASQNSTENGKVLTSEALAVLAQYTQRLAAVRKKIATMRAKLAANDANRVEYQDLNASIRRILVALVRRRAAEDRLQAEAVKAAKIGAKAAMRGAGGF